VTVGTVGVVTVGTVGVVTVGTVGVVTVLVLVAVPVVALSPVPALLRSELSSELGSGAAADVEPVVVVGTVGTVGAVGTEGTVGVVVVVVVGKPGSVGSEGKVAVVAAAGTQKSAAKLETASSSSMLRSRGARGRCRCIARAAQVVAVCYVVAKIRENNKRYRRMRDSKPESMLLYRSDLIASLSY